MENLHWNYVYINMNYNTGGRITRDEFNAICLRDLESESNIQVIPDSLEGFPRLLRLANKAHYSPRINRSIRLPFKSVWYSKLYNIKFSDETPICFVIANSGVPLKYLEFLRKKYKGCRIVRVYRDLLRICEINPDYNIDTLDRIYDLRLTIDENEAEQYGMVCFHEIESKIPLDCSPPYDYDVFFAGKAKDRLSNLVRAYDILSESGLKCQFYITHVDPDARIKREGIQYADSFMSYMEILRLTAKAKCLLDINQEGAVGFTSRFLEAVMYNKLLISNNPTVLKSKYYTPEYIQLIRDVKDIDPSFITRQKYVDYSYQNDFSPVNLIRLIDDELEKRGIEE